MAVQSVSTALPPDSEPAAAAPMFHHVGIQTADLDNSVRWYQAFLTCEENWRLDRFSELTLSRLPGITELVEIEVGNLRLHLFEREALTGLEAQEAVRFQHVCLSVDSPEELAKKRQLWLELFGNGAYQFAVTEEPSEIVVDSDGVQSFYAFDVNGLELELSYLPGQTEGEDRREK